MISIQKKTSNKCCASYLRVYDKQKLTEYYIGQSNKIDTLKDQHIGARVEDLVCETGDIFLHIHIWFLFHFLVNRHRKTYCVWSRVCSSSTYSRESMNESTKKNLYIRNQFIWNRFHSLSLLNHSI